MGKRLGVLGVVIALVALVALVGGLVSPALGSSSGGSGSTRSDDHKGQTIRVIFVPAEVAEIDVGAPGFSVGDGVCSRATCNRMVRRWVATAWSARSCPRPTRHGLRPSAPRPQRSPGGRSRSKAWSSTGRWASRCRSRVVPVCTRALQEKWFSATLRRGGVQGRTDFQPGGLTAFSKPSASSSQITAAPEPVQHWTSSGGGGRVWPIPVGACLDPQLVPPRSLRCVPPRPVRVQGLRPVAPREGRDPGRRDAGVIGVEDVNEGVLQEWESGWDDV